MKFNTKENWQKIKDHPVFSFAVFIVFLLVIWLIASSLTKPTVEAEQTATTEVVVEPTQTKTFTPTATPEPTMTPTPTPTYLPTATEEPIETPSGNFP